MPRGDEIKIVDGASTYILPTDGAVARIQLNDWSQPTLASGRQDANSRYLRNSLLIGNIVNAFGPARIGGGNVIDAVSGLNLDTHLAHGDLHTLRDSEAETEFGEITLPRRRQTPSIPGAGGDADVAGNGDGGIMRQPKAAVFFEGTQQSGVYTWYVDDGDLGANPYELHYIRWDSSIWNDEATVNAANASIDAGFDMVVHKGALCFLYSTNPNNVTPIVARSTTGTGALTAMTNSPTSNAQEGSRLLDSGTTLWAFIQLEKNFNIMKTTDNGATAWTSVVTGVNGQVRDVGIFFDRNDTSRIVILTFDTLYWLDETNNVVNQLIALPFRGRALATWGSKLLVFMDAGKVFSYAANGDFPDISPGGKAGMPSGKDFDLDPDGQVCVARTATGVYAFWSGDTASGGDQALILKYTGDGWHYKWEQATANRSQAARFLAFDPLSGDLLGAINDVSGNADSSSMIQLKDVEMDPRLLGTAAEFEETGYVETSLLMFAPTQVSTTMWDWFLNTEDVDATETVTPNYGINGAVSTTTALAAQTANRVTVNFEPTSNLGVNFYTVRYRLVLARQTGAANDDLTPKVLNSEIAFLKIPPVRWVYVFNVIVRGRPRRGMPKPSEVMKNVKTILALKTKVLLSYGDELDLALLPLPQSKTLEQIGPLEGRLAEPRTGVWTIYLAEV